MKVIIVRNVKVPLALGLQNIFGQRRGTFFFQNVFSKLQKGTPEDENVSFCENLSMKIADSRIRIFQFQKNMV